jgi:glycosyltransferase involved in cell wall biosynthesis
MQSAKKKTSEMNILFLATWYPNHFDPMYGLFVQRHAKAAAINNKVCVLHIVKDEKTHAKREILIDKEKNLTEVCVVYRPVCGKIPILNKAFSAFQFLVACLYGLRYIKAKSAPPDIVHVHVLTRMGLVALLIKIFKGIPYIITEHWSRYQKVTGNYKGFFRRIITGIVVKNASILTTVTADLLSAMNEQGLKNQNSRILPNVVDDAFFIDCKSRKALHPFRLVHVSCFEDRSKNIGGILRVAKRLQDNGSEFELIMIGDGPDFEMMKSYCRELEISNETVIFKGLKTADEIAENFCISDFLLMFSHYENLPVVINEAFACGLAVISSDVGGISEIVKEGFGYLVQPGNEDELYNLIESLIAENVSVDASEMRQFAYKSFSAKAVADILNNIYKEVSK